MGNFCAEMLVAGKTEVLSVRRYFLRLSEESGGGFLLLANALSQSVSSIH